MSKITIYIKPTATSEKLTLEIEPSISVSDLKEEIALKQSIAAAEQRLIYKGQILKDERTVESYGEGEGGVDGILEVSISFTQLHLCWAAYWHCVRSAKNNSTFKTYILMHRSGS